MKKAGTFIFILILLSACNHHSTYITHQAFDNYVEMNRKAIPNWSDSNEIKSFSDSHFFSVKSWYDDNDILYIRQNQERNQVVKYQLFNGNHSVFYESKYPITQIKPSYNFQYFLIEARGDYNQSIITILDHDGHTLYKRIKAFDYAEYAWSPYQEGECVVSLYDSSEHPDVIIINMQHPNQEQKLDIDPSIKWNGPHSLVYFEWENENALYGAIKAYDIETEMKKSLIDKAIAFDTRKNEMMYSRVNNDLTEITFNFMKQNNLKPYSELHVPLLNANSGYIWSPSFDWNAEKDSFITYAPLEASSFLEYKQGYNLILFNTKTTKQTVILNADHSSELAFSPNGEYCLTGDQLSEIINLKTKREMKLVN